MSKDFFDSLNDLRDHCYNAALTAGWYHDVNTGEPLVRNKGEMFMLMVSEISEAMEGARKNKKDDHLPNRPSEEVELGDAVIRIMDFCGYHKLDIAGAIREKMAYNKQRADHKPEARKAAGGKAF
jgi:NTP pyrophosphatase (non-canonical NTP hydrolase)